jgi:hypothetical protein
LRYGNGGIPFYVAVIVVGGEIGVGQILVGVSGTPEFVHHFDVEIVV